MAGLLAATGKVADVEELVRTALRREEQGTTGLGEEIAIPHAKTDAVTAPVVGFARSAEGVEWGSLDGTKAKLVFMISVPEAAAGDEHLRILALLSRKLTDAGFRERLMRPRRGGGPRRAARDPVAARIAGARVSPRLGPRRRRPRWTECRAVSYLVSGPAASTCRSRGPSDVDVPAVRGKEHLLPRTEISARWSVPDRPGRPRGPRPSRPRPR